VNDTEIFLTKIYW